MAGGGPVSRVPDFSTRSGVSRTRLGWERLLLGTAAALLLASAARAPGAIRDARESEARIAELRREVESDRDRLRALESRRRAGGDLLTSQLVLTAEAAPARVLAEITELLPPDVRLESASFSYSSRLEIETQLVARRPASYDVFLERVAGSPLFTEVLPGPEAREDEMRASLRMAYRRLP